MRIVDGAQWRPGRTCVFCWYIPRRLAQTKPVKYCSAAKAWEGCNICPIFLSLSKHAPTAIILSCSRFSQCTLIFSQLMCIVPTDANRSALFIPWGSYPLNRARHIELKSRGWRTGKRTRDYLRILFIIITAVF